MREAVLYAQDPKVSLFGPRCGGFVVARTVIGDGEGKHVSLEIAGDAQSRGVAAVDAVCGVIRLDTCNLKAGKREAADENSRQIPDYGEIISKPCFCRNAPSSHHLVGLGEATILVVGALRLNGVSFLGQPP